MVGVGHYLYLLATLKVSPSALQSPLNLTPNKPVTSKIDANTFKKNCEALKVIELPERRAKLVKQHCELLSFSAAFLIYYAITFLAHVPKQKFHHHLFQQCQRAEAFSFPVYPLEI